MKIVHVTWMFTFGGIETMLVNICNEQIKLGHDVHLIVMEDSTVESTLYDSLDKRIKLHYGHRKNGANLLLPMLRLNYLLYELHPNVIHIHSSSMYKLILVPWHKKITNATLHALPKPKNTQSIDLVHVCLLSLIPFDEPFLHIMERRVSVIPMVFVRNLSNNGNRVIGKICCR